MYETTRATSFNSWVGKTKVERSGETRGGSKFKKSSVGLIEAWGESAHLNLVIAGFLSEDLPGTRGEERAVGNPERYLSSLVLSQCASTSTPETTAKDPEKLHLKTGRNMS